MNNNVIFHVLLLVTFATVSFVVITPCSTLVLCCLFVIIYERGRNDKSSLPESRVIAKKTENYVGVVYGSSSFISETFSSSLLLSTRFLFCYCCLLLLKWKRQRKNCLFFEPYLLFCSVYTIRIRNIAGTKKTMLEWKYHTTRVSKKSKIQIRPQGTSDIRKRRNHKKRV